ncbi:MAG TPA: hypothetical protein VFM19_02440 [Candidatus Limnocylindria bacterium]|nr:hypothetical protein [Candidatus Limnocylindria bacterium]
MRRALAVSAISALLAACVMGVAPTPTANPLNHAPPVVSIDGVDGSPISWCVSATSCADGSPEDASAVIADPATLALPAEATDAHVAVGCNLACATDLAEADVALAGTRIGPLPAGTWEYLTVTVRLGQGGTASSAWRLR